MTILCIALLGIVAYMAWLLFEQRRLVSRQDTDIERLRDERKTVFDLLHDLGEVISESINIRDLTRVAANCAASITMARGAAVFLHEPGRGFRAAGVSGVFPPLLAVPPDLEAKIATRTEHLDEIVRSQVSEQGVPLLEEVLRSGALLVADASADARFPGFQEEAIRWHSAIAVPLAFRKNKAGVLIVANRRDGAPFTAADVEMLQSVAAQAAFALHSARVSTQLAEKERLDRDIEVAREIQRVLLPSACPKVPGFEVAALNLPAREVSGDYFDFIPLDAGRVGIAVADVSGKGVPASLIMAICRSVLRGQAPGRASAAETLRSVNHQLFPDIREDMFITMVYAILDPGARTLTLARAGHEAALHCHDRRVEMLRPSGMALGIDSGLVFDSVTADLTVDMEPGDVVLLYTDGVTEALDTEGNEFGKDNLKEAVLVAAPDGADAVIRNIRERLERFRAHADKSDDVTMVALYAGNR